MDVMQHAAPELLQRDQYIAWNIKGAVHILEKICPRSDPHIAHIGYYLDLYSVSHTKQKGQFSISTKMFLQILMCCNKPIWHG